MTRLWLITYDISANDPQQKYTISSKIMANAYNAACLNAILKPFQLQELQRRLSSLMELTEDQVRYYSLCGKDKQHTVIDGAGWVSADPDYNIL